MFNSLSRWDWDPEEEEKDDEGFDEKGDEAEDVVMDAPSGQYRFLATFQQGAAAAGGHATLVMGHDRSAGVFAPLKSPLDRIHRELKRAFDPDGVFNPGRLYPGLCP